MTSNSPSVSIEVPASHGHHVQAERASEMHVGDVDDAKPVLAVADMARGAKPRLVRDEVMGRRAATPRAQGDGVVADAATT